MVDQIDFGVGSGFQALLINRFRSFLIGYGLESEAQFVTPTISGVPVAEVYGVKNFNPTLTPNF